MPSHPTMHRRRPNISTPISTTRPLPIIEQLRSQQQKEDLTNTSTSESEWHTDAARSAGEDADNETYSKINSLSSQQLLAASPLRWKNWWIRTIWTLVMVTGFFLILLLGPAYVILLIVMLQLAVFKEVIQIAHVPSKERKLPWFRLINWYFLAATNYYLYGESLLQHLSHLIPRVLLPLATHHRFISYILYCIGLVFFVLNLKRGFYKFQFSQFSWAHMTLLLVVVQSHFIINNIFQGLIWFIIPSTLVIVNDVFAYISGFFWGRTPLIKLSPKKTWEGFVGGAICTLIFGFVTTTYIIRVPYFICPVKDTLGVSYWSEIHCEPQPEFLTTTFTIPTYLPIVGGKHLHLASMQLHTIVFSLFASSIAPFGGFFASGIKRAFKIKDFGDTIPGHGGITDRFDCQFMMGTFSFMYMTTFINRLGGLNDIIQRLVILSTADKIVLLKHLVQMLQESDDLPSNSMVDSYLYGIVELLNPGANL